MEKGKMIVLKNDVTGKELVKLTVEEFATLLEVHMNNSINLTAKTEKVLLDTFKEGLDEIKDRDLAARSLFKKISKLNSEDVIYILTILYSSRPFIDMLGFSSN